MRQYRVVHTGYMFGIECFAGDIITIISSDRWSVSNHPDCVFIGNILNEFSSKILSLGEKSNKSKIEIKINQMWNRQPYMQKQLGAVK